MPAIPVIAILDVGKTNKKIFLLDEQYKIVWQQADAFAETTDEEGEACEDVDMLRAWVFKSISVLDGLNDFDIRAINFCAYGASFVHVGEAGMPVAPLYNYLKPFPDSLKKKLYDSYGGEVTFSMLTASPVLGSLNSGMQLYRIKEQQPEVFAEIKYSLHLPQYLSFLCTGVACSDITSVGCHTNLWNFSQQHYHEWVYREGIIDKLAPILPSTSVKPMNFAAGGGREAPSGVAAGGGASRIPVAGIGLHDSSAALIPYLESFREPFILISTGTWCISMNPFNDSPLTVAELQRDCLCYLSYQGRPVKASRLFAGYEHELQVKRLAAHFQVAPAAAASIEYDPECVALLRKSDGRKLDGRPSRGGASGPTERRASGPAKSGASGPTKSGAGGQAGGRRRKAGGAASGGTASAAVTASAFGGRELGDFDNYEQAYHCLMMDIMDQQIASTRLLLRDQGVPVNRIFVDGGFGKNQVYMHLLAAAFPEMEVFAASMPQATAIGAALAIHPHWNTRSLPGDIIELKYYI